MTAKRPPLAPIRVYDQKHHLRKPTLRTATQRAQQRQAHAFNPSHRAGDALAAHRHLATVLRRASHPFRTHTLLPNGDSYYKLS